MDTTTTEYETTTPAARPLRVGSLCTGYGGLDLAVEHVLGAAMDWCAESDPHAAEVIAAHWPAAPNFGDLRSVDWLCAPPVDVVTAGFPCQPVSNAGRRKGPDDDRWLWPDVAHALRWIRPRYVVLENVAAIVGRGMDAVLGSLASMGFDAVWGCYTAAAAGACHKRDRWFLYGWRPGQPGALADAAGVRGRGPAVQADAESRSGAARSFPASGSVFTEAPSDTAGVRHGNARPAASGGVPAVPVRSAPPPAGRTGLGWGLNVDWNAYEPAVRRWEAVTGRPAPAPTVMTEKGLRSSTAFVEWMQGLPGGWVTGRGLPRTAELRLLGNGVVPQQAVMALADLAGHAAPIGRA